MKKILWIVVLLTVIISCKQEPKPAIIDFANLTCCDYIDINSYYLSRERSDDLEIELNKYEFCENKTTKKPGIIYSCELKEPVGFPKITAQIILEKSHLIIDGGTGDVDPALTSLEWYYNLPKKGKYIVNLIANDKIIARGEIEYR